MRRATRACAIWLALTLTVGLFALLTATITLRVLIAVGIALGNEYGPIGNLLLTVSGLATSYAVAVGAHEVGHVVGGGIVGGTPRFVRVGPVTWTRRGGGANLDDPEARGGQVALGSRPGQRV